MANPPSKNPLNQSDTSSGLQQPSSSKPPNDSPPPKPELAFSIDDMATSEFSENLANTQTFTILTPMQSDE
jgi:hypothetical protein